MSFECPEGLRCICAQKALGHGAAAAFSGDFKHLGLCFAYASVCAGSAVLVYADPSGVMSLPVAGACGTVARGLIAYEAAHGNNNLG